jgi:hypothetical protein
MIVTIIINNHNIYIINYNDMNFRKKNATVKVISLKVQTIDNATRYRCNELLRRAHLATRPHHTTVPTCVRRGEVSRISVGATTSGNLSAKRGKRISALND